MRASWRPRRAPAGSATCCSTWPGTCPTAGLLDTEMALDDAMASVESREGEVVAEIKAELKRALEWAGDARTRKWLEKRADEKIKRQQRRLRTRDCRR